MTKLLGWVRSLGFLALAVAAVVAFSSPVPDGADGYNIGVARTTSDENNTRTEGAPQQQVVNGWLAADLLEVIARQGSDQREETLLLIIALAVIWHGITQPRRARTTSLVAANSGPASRDPLAEVAAEPSGPNA